MIVDQNWLLHNSRDDFFRSPCGAVFCNSRIDLKVQIRTGNSPEWVALRLWQQGKEDHLPMDLWRDDGNSKVYRAEITVSAVPGILWYHFAVGLKGKTYYYGNNSRLLGGVGQHWCSR